MKRYSTVLRRSIVATVAILLLAGGSPQPMPAAAQSLLTLHVGALPTDNAGGLYYAQDLGFFKKAGLDVQIETFQNGSAMAAALTAGAIDVGQANVAAIAAGHLRGFDYKLFAPAAVNTNKTQTDVLMVAKDSEIRSASDLNGKTVGIIAVKSMQQVLAMAWMDKHGGDAKSLKFVEVPFPAMGAQLEAHRVDAVFPTEPFTTQFKSVGRALGNTSDSFGAPFVVVAWAAKGDWLQTHHDDATRFLSAIREAAIWGNSHRKESADILVRYSKLDPSVAQTMERATYTTTLDATLVQPVIDASAKYGAIDKTFPAAEILWP